MDNVVLVTVPDLDTAKEVTTESERLHGEHGLRLLAAAIVERAAEADDAGASPAPGGRPGHATDG